MDGRTRRTAITSAVADLVAVVVFVAIGRRSHDEGGNVVTASKGSAVLCVVTDAAVSLARTGTIMELLVDLVAQGLAVDAPPPAGAVRERVEEGFALALKEIDRL